MDDTPAPASVDFSIRGTPAITTTRVISYTPTPPTA